MISCDTKSFQKLKNFHANAKIIKDRLA